MRDADDIGGNPDRLYVGGQSSSGHLAAVALTTDWWRGFGLPRDIIKGGMCISGMYDLTPVRLSARSRYPNRSLGTARAGRIADRPVWV